jgi:hypothetical protein
VGHHDVRREGRVLDGLGVGQHELHVPEAQAPGLLPSVLDRASVHVDADHAATPESQGQGETSTTGPDVEPAELGQRLGLQQPEERGADANLGCTNGHPEPWYRGRVERGLCPRNPLGGGFGRGAKPPSEEHQPVTAPSEALDTSRAYLAITPQA